MPKTLKIKVPWNIQKVEKQLKIAFTKNSETQLLNILKTNTFLFYFLFDRKGGAQPVFREITFGSKLRCDFCWLNDNSDGPEWVLVELEKPRMKIFLADNKPSKELNAALEQVKTWQRYFSKYPAEKSRIFGAVARFRFVLVAGDKKSWETDHAMNWRSHNNDTTQIEIRSTEVFLRALKEIKEHPEDFWSFAEHPTTGSFKMLEHYWKTYGYMDNMRKYF